MKGTFNTPWGKLRCASQRRYIVVYRSAIDGKPRIEKRSDYLGTARRYKSVGDVIIDTHTGAEA